MKIHFITSYVPNSKFNLHRTCKFFHTYKLQYTHCFFQAKTANSASNLCFLQKKMKLSKQKKVTDISLYLWQLTLLKKNTTKDI